MQPYRYLQRCLGIALLCIGAPQGIAAVAPPRTDASIAAPSLSITPQSAASGTTRNVVATAVPGADGYVFLVGASPGSYADAYPLDVNSFSTNIAVTQTSTIYVAVAATMNGAWSPYSNEVAVTTTAATATNDVSQTDADTVFAWAEKAYGPYFSPASPTTQAVAGGFKRSYSGSGSSLAVINHRLVYSGALSQNKDLDAGDFTDWLNQAKAGTGSTGSGGNKCTTPADYRFSLPFNLDTAKQATWAHGAHGPGHPEGHPGIDFYFDSEQTVTSPIDGVVESYGSAEAGDCVIINSPDFCVQIVPCFKRDAGIEVGTKLTKGQVIGKTAAAPGAKEYMLHFGTRFGSPPVETCPAEYQDPEFVRCQLGQVAGQTDPTDCQAVPLRSGGTLMHNVTAANVAAHDMTLSCVDGTTYTLHVPIEPKLCNDRLADTVAKKKMQDCLQFPDHRMW